MREDWPEWRGEINRVGPLADPATSFYTAPLPPEKPREPPPPSPRREAALVDRAWAMWHRLVWLGYDATPGSYTEEMKLARDKMHWAFWWLELVEDFYEDPELWLWDDEWPLCENWAGRGDDIAKIGGALVMVVWDDLEQEYQEILLNAQAPFSAWDWWPDKSIDIEF